MPGPRSTTSPIHPLVHIVPHPASPSGSAIENDHSIRDGKVIGNTQRL